MNSDFDVTLVTYIGAETPVPKGAQYDPASERLIFDSANLTFGLSLRIFDSIEFRPSTAPQI